MIETEEVNDITFIPQEWHCGDGCCDEYWLDCLINGELLSNRYMEPLDTISDILAHFGINSCVDFIEGNERSH